MECADPAISNVRWKGVVFLMVCLIFIPKINIISIAGEYAGIRFDDIAIALFFLFLAIALYSTRPTVKIFQVEAAYAAFSLYSITATSALLLALHSGKILYSLRLIEYYVFFLLGVYSYSLLNLRKIFIYFIIANTVVILLQYFGVVGGFASEGFGENFASRPIGTTGGPWEIAGICNLLFCFFMVRINYLSYWRKYFIFGIWTTCLILITAARAPLLAQFFLLIYFALVGRSAKQKILFLLAALASVSFLLFLAIYFSAGVVERSVNLVSKENITAFSDVYSSVYVRSGDTTLPDFDDYANDTADLSWLMRVTKWTFAVKYWSSSLVNITFGVGAGAWGIALDGGLLRIVTESGVIGAVLFSLFLYQSYRISTVTASMTIAFLVNLTMIDIYMAYKFMAVFLLIIGYESVVKFKSRVIVS